MLPNFARDFKINFARYAVLQDLIRLIQYLIRIAQRFRKGVAKIAPMLVGVQIFHDSIVNRAQDLAVVLRSHTKEFEQIPRLCLFQKRSNFELHLRGRFIAQRHKWRIRQLGRRCLGFCQKERSQRRNDLGRNRHVEHQPRALPKTVLRRLRLAHHPLHTPI